ncbi:hypothetical protein [Candidatus Enterococcus murrayae]|uniref:Uncharacterized protein n=1 Tax=Candidatus Enterococcus murrayae TaxID=2815321 RepID=A0ABS3HCF0_9ENTE|nr:hypothetical protein [Enterococcus sp. MJM16]MBO0451129.1 hypothetical protein [Enterococcus sp. MJM16]
MKKNRIVELTLLIIILGIGFWNVKQQQKILYLRSSVESLVDDNKNLKVKQNELISENDRLEKAAESSAESLKRIQKEIANTGVDLNDEFITFVSKLFEANLNFSPNNYSDRKKTVSGYLSDELIKEYFGQGRNTYQESNHTNSKLESIEVYPKGIQNSKLSGLVVVYYKSKQVDQDWMEGMNIFKVTYDSHTKKVTEIENLGSGYFG